MKENRLSYNIIILMLVIYIIASLQFVIRESKDLIRIYRLPYWQKADNLDSSYYKHAYYRYYVWLDYIIPKNMSFSILYNKDVEPIYTRYERKLNYYFYPRHVLFNGVDMYAYHKKGHVMLSSLKYPEFVLVLDKNKVKYNTREGRIYLYLNGNEYVLISVLEDKALLLRSTFLDLLKKKVR